VSVDCRRLHRRRCARALVLRRRTAVLHAGLAHVLQDAGELSRGDFAPIVQGALERAAAGLDVGSQPAARSEGLSLTMSSSLH